MEDRDIIKALECCSIGYCQAYRCPARNEGCRTGLIKSALDLINRQKAEIEALIAGQETLQKLTAEMLKDLAEAVKMEFYREFDELIPSIMADKIDNLVKEMVGADDD